MEHLSLNQAAEYLGVGTRTLIAYASYADDRNKLAPVIRRPLFKNSFWSLEQLKAYKNKKKRNKLAKASPKEEQILAFDHTLAVLHSMNYLMTEAISSSQPVNHDNILEVTRKIVHLGKAKEDSEILDPQRLFSLSQQTSQLIETAKTYKSTFSNQKEDSQ